MRVLSLVAALSLAAGSAFAQSGGLITHQFVVHIESSHDLHDILEEYNLVVLASYEPHGLYLVSPSPADPNRDDDEVEAQLGLDDRIALNEQNRENYAEDGHTQSFFVGIAPIEFARQPTFEFIGLNGISDGANGQGITVAILDTGVAPHYEYWRSLRPDGENFIDGYSPVSDGSNGVDSNGNGIFDELAGHGTFVAGLISHLAPDIQILPIRVLDSDGVGSSFSVAAGIYYAIDHGAKVINLSLSSPYDSAAVREAAQAAQAANVAIVASVANNGSSLPEYPAAIPGVLAVGATDLKDRRLAMSDFGPYLSFSAPGYKVISSYPGNLYASASGTSISTALVSGGLARKISSMPNAPVSVAAQALYNSAVDINRMNWFYRGNVGKRLNLGGKTTRIAPDTVVEDKP